MQSKTRGKEHSKAHLAIFPPPVFKKKQSTSKTTSINTSKQRTLKIINGVEDASRHL
jgi:hypothetical protein